MPLLKNISLKDYSNYKIGGEAQYFLKASSKEELIQGVSQFRQSEPDGQIFILGGGTNVLIPDEGIKGLVVFNDISGVSLDGQFVKAESGILFSDLVKVCIDNSLSGLEWAGGLPGTVGGAVRGNAGAFGGEVKENVVKVMSISLADFSEHTREKDELKYSYRDSTFKSGDGKDEFILEVWFDLKKGNQAEIKKVVQDKVDFRWARHPMDLPNIGSTFKNIPLEQVSSSQKVEFAQFIKNDPFPIVPVAKLLSLAGLKGKRVGDAQVSEKHPNFIVNLGSAKATDVLELIKIEKEEIKKLYGLDLEEEIIVL